MGEGEHHPLTLIDHDGLRALGLKYSKWTLKRWENQGMFPKRYRINGGRAHWRLSEIEKWMASLPTE